MTQQSFSRPGAIDLSGLRTPPTAPGGGPASNGAGLVMDVSEATFQADVLDRSMTVPVVIDLWADWCGPCKQLSPILERLAGEYAGQFVLAKIDVDRNRQLAAAAGVQSIPLVLAVVKGQVVPLFQGAVPEAQVRQFLDELLKVAAANGITGTAEPPAPDEGGEPEPPPADPRYAEAEAALARGDLATAIAGYQRVLDQTPADPVARAGLAGARLVQRSDALDPAAVRVAAAADRTDVAAACAAADLDVTGGQVEEAFGRLVQTIAVVSGDDRDRARRHLLELFEVVGSDDPRVRAARQQLSAALF